MTNLPKITLNNYFLPWEPSKSAKKSAMKPDR